VDVDKARHEQAPATLDDPRLRISSGDLSLRPHGDYRRSIDGNRRSGQKLIAGRSLVVGKYSDIVKENCHKDLLVG
jgi:hypothetical protein